ncbi:MAG: glycosyltransferase family 4 protein [Pseudohongiellaceae bacterium]
MKADATVKTLQLGLVGPVPPPNGGMAMQTQQLARLLQSEGIAVDLLATNGQYRPAFMAGVPVIRALFRLIPFLFALWRLAGRVDVIHLMANSGWSWQLHCAPTLWLGWLRSTPVVVNYRGGEAGTYFARSFRRVRPSLRKAAAVVVPSGYLQALFRQFGETTRIIPNIIDRELFHPRTGRTPGTFTLVVTRNLEAIYGIDTAIRAFAQVLAGDSSVRLRIAGSGPAETSLRELVRDLDIDEAVSFEGRLDRPGIVALYAEADAMLNPSTVDNMPNSVLEALACGLPVISTDVGGVPFIVCHRETALLIPPSDINAMAEAIRELKGNAALRRTLSSSGLAELEQYTWPRVRRQWLALYTNLSGTPQKVTS